MGAAAKGERVVGRGGEARQTTLEAASLTDWLAPTRASGTSTKRKTAASGGARALLALADQLRLDASRDLNPESRRQLGQFLTPAHVAALLASMFATTRDDIRLLDPGAGVGSLTAAFVARICSEQRPPKSLTVTAFEVDAQLIDPLTRMMRACSKACDAAGVKFQFSVVNADFIRAAADALSPTLGERTTLGQFDCAILNPPYRKINVGSSERTHLARVGLATTNLYTGFAGLALRLLAPGGQMVAITPRSFCNGAYFKSFRRVLLESSALKQLHVFERRDSAFKDDDVLQENVVFRVVRGASKNMVLVSTSAGNEDAAIASRELSHEAVVSSSDPELVVHIPSDERTEGTVARIRSLPCRLEDIALTVSTGRVVDFRASAFLSRTPVPHSVALIYACHLESGFVQWPRANSRKPNALLIGRETETLLVPSGPYVLVKRFTSKEERRRVVAAVFDPSMVAGKRVAFENHLNYFHDNGKALPPSLAKGLAAYLNSTSVDVFFRQFSGHTQVNATDLRMLPYPSRRVLQKLGCRINGTFPDQEALDQLVNEEVFT